MLPSVSIITPSFNQGQYIEQTILSVLGQQYPFLQYIVIDGGSTDNTFEILKKYDSQISFWQSEKDGGQADAINKGIAIATGDIIMWVNSDDMLMPGVLQTITSNIDVNKPELICGNCLHFEEVNNEVKTRGSSVPLQHSANRLSFIDYIIQPSSCFTRKALEVAGLPDASMHYAFDWEWFLRCQRNGVEIRPVPFTMSLYRIHSAHKSGSNSNTRRDEILHIYETYEPRLADLYRLLMEERLFYHSRKCLWLRRMIKLAGGTSSYGEVLKWRFPAKYRLFTATEITTVALML